MSQFDAGQRQALEAESGQEPATVFKGIPDQKGRRWTPWTWVPSAYFAEGIPYVIAMWLSVVMYKRLGISNEAIAFWTSMLYLPWTIKPIWSPLVDMYWTKRNWIVWMQLFMAIGLGAATFALQLPVFFKITIIIFFAIAFFSATHDIACDGFYMLGLSEGQQTWYVGIRSAFYRLAMIFCQGVLVVLAGQIESRTGLAPVSLHAIAIKEDAAAPVLPPLTYPALSGADGQRILLVDSGPVQVKAGQKASFHVRLAEPPPEGKPIAVTFDRVAGSKTLDIDSGARVEFDDKNWDVPTTVTLKASKSLRVSEYAEFRATAGNVRLAWTITIGFCAILFFLFFIYHSAVLPFPFKDKPLAMEGERPPFVRAAFWLGVTGVLVFVVLYVGMSGIGLVTSPLKKWVIDTYTSLPPDKWESLFKVLRLLILTGLIIWIFTITSARKVMGDTFSDLSRMSGLAFDEVFVSFFRKPGIGLMLAFLLLYRLGEAQLVKLATPFLLDTRDVGGLGFSTGDVGIAYGTVGLICLTIGGILGGMAVSAHGLKKWLFLMCCAINLPDLLYVYLAYALPDNFMVVVACVGIEQLGYGFGFAAYMVYMLYCAQGPYKTAHFAICTGFMALGMMIPGMISGSLQFAMGYPKFFILVCILTLPGFLLLPFIPLDANFGKKEKKVEKAA